MKIKTLTSALVLIIILAGCESGSQWTTGIPTRDRVPAPIESYSPEQRAVLIQGLLGMQAIQNAQPHGVVQTYDPAAIYQASQPHTLHCAPGLIGGFDCN